MGIKIARQNKRPPQLNVPDDIYQPLLRCWDLDPQRRPDLSEIMVELNNMLIKYRFLAKRATQRRGSSSIHGATSIYSEPTQMPPRGAAFTMTSGGGPMQRPLPLV